MGLAAENVSSSHQDSALFRPPRIRVLEVRIHSPPAEGPQNFRFRKKYARLRRATASLKIAAAVTGCVAALVRRDDILKVRSYVATQGRCIGRDGRVAIEFDNDTIWLGGHAVTCIEGWLDI